MLNSRWRSASLAATLGLMVLALLPAQPAWAHSVLLHTAPADGAVVRQPTDVVVLTFNEMVSQRFTTVVVTGPDGQSYSDGRVHVVDTAVNQAVYPLRSGPYHVAWRAISADGHPVQGEFGFTVQLPPSMEPTAGPPRTAAAAAATTNTNTTPWWPWLAGAGVLVAVAAVVVQARRRAR